MKKIITAIFIITLMLGLTACQGKSDKITVVLDWTPNTNHTGMYVALEKGYYKELGLDVEIIQPPEDGAMSLVASQKAQFGVSVQEGIAAALSADNPLEVTAIASIVDHNTSGLISPKEKNIVTPKDLMGKKYATWDMPIEKAVLKDIVTKDGGDFSKVELIPSTVTNVLAAIKSDIDAVWIFYGWDGIAAEINNIPVNYIPFKDINPVFDFYTPVLVSSDDYISENPETVKKFLEATQKGYEYAISEPISSADILLKYAPEIDKELAYKSQEYLSAEYKAEKPRWGTFDENRWTGFFNWLYENKLITKDLQSKGFTNDYLPQ